MPFLSRRSVDPLNSMSPPKDRGLSQKQSILSQNPRNRARSEGNLFRRVSTFFTVRRRTSSKASFSHANPSSAGIGYIHSCSTWSTLPRVSNASTTYSSLEIRRPSGLGRRASLLQSSDSDDSNTDCESLGTVLDEENIPPTGLAGLSNLSDDTLHSSEGLRITSLEPPLSRRCTASFALPDTIFRLVLEFLPRNDLPVVGLVSRGFCSVARYSLYHSLDTQNMAESSRERLYTVLASRKELAALVVSFYCHAWPSREYSSLDDSSASVASSSGNVRRVFQNMFNLKSLTLPSFLSILSHTPSFTFSLSHLTVLDKKMTQSQLVALRSWLATQPSLQSLSFPHLVEYTSTDSSFVDEWSPASDSKNSFTTILPSLKSLHASAEIVSALCFAMNHPIQHLTLDVRETLYMGLRPGSVIRCLSGVRDMHIIFSPKVDKRTVEKFLAVTGSILTARTRNKANAMKSLEVEVLWTDNDAAERLYGIVTSIISRFRGLETLKLTSPFRSIQATMPASVSVSLIQPPCPAPSPPQTVAVSDPSSTAAAALRGSTTRKEFVACGIEQNYAKTWTKHCPSLADIQFDFSCSTTEAEVELCGVWFRRRMPLLLSHPRTHWH